MNCKPNDLAVVVIDTRGHHLGKIVKCLRSRPGIYLSTPCWETDPTLRDPGGCVMTPNDVALRPIRPQDDDADCESRAWLPPVPRTVPAPTKEHAT